MEQDTDIVLERLLARYGMLFSKELDIDLDANTPSALFRWLCAALLMSARISHEAAIAAARALSDEGLITAERMKDSSWETRVRILNDSGYARFDESTASMLGDTAEHLLESYDGDLRGLRTVAERDPDNERTRLKACKGIGEVGADIFFRELQTVWPEHFPFLDGHARTAAQRLGVPHTAEALADRVGQDAFPALVTALVRANLDDATREQLLANGAKAAR